MTSKINVLGEIRNKQFSIVAKKLIERLVQILGKHCFTAEDLSKQNSLRNSVAQTDLHEYFP